MARDPLPIRKISENDKIATFGRVSGVDKKNLASKIIDVRK